MSTKIKSFVFLDCETTGLEKDNKITELSLVAVHADHLLIDSNQLPRVLNKLSLCINPMKRIHPFITDMTGLDNDMLEEFEPFSNLTADMLNAFLKCLPQPACLVAHNGNKFDYIVLQTHLNKIQRTLPNDLLVVDSLKLFIQHYHFELDKNETLLRESKQKEKTVHSDLMDDEWDLEFSHEIGKIEADIKFVENMSSIQKKLETTPKRPKLTDKSVEGTRPGISKLNQQKLHLRKNRPSFKLNDLFERITGQIASDHHQAECDVFMLMKCAACLGPAFISIANEIAIPFSNINI